MTSLTINKSSTIRFVLMTSLILAGFVQWTSGQRFQSNRSSSSLFGGFSLFPEANETVEKDLEYYMEEEDEIYYHPWRSDRLEYDEEDEEDEIPKYDVLDEEGLTIYDADGRRRPVDHILGHFSRLNNSYIVLTPIIARPSTVFRVVVLPFKTENPNQQIDLRATLTSTKGAELSYAVGKGTAGDSSELMMKLPDALPGPYLRLRIEGRQGPNVAFVNTTIIHPSNDFLTIVVFMSRPAYTGGQNVEFRVALMTNSMLPYQEPVDVFILDPNGYIVRRWISRVPNVGFMDLKFDAPTLPATGFWRVRVKAKTQVKDHPFLVTKYFIPRFEIMFEVAPFFLASDESITGLVVGVVTSDSLIYGNMTTTLYVKYPATADDSEYKQVGDPIEEVMTEGEVEFEIPMDDFQGYVPQLPGAEVKAVVEIIDSFTGTTTKGYWKTRIISGDVTVNFVGASPVVFRPGMPLTLSVNVAYDDMESLDPEDLAKSSLRITANAIRSTGGSKDLPILFIPPEDEEGAESEIYMNLQREFESNITDIHDDEQNYLNSVRFESLMARETYILRSQFDEFRQSGIFTFTLEIPKHTIALTVNAVFSDSEGSTTGAKLEGRANIHHMDKQLHVTSSTEHAVVGEFAVFHVRTNFPLEKFHYIIMSKGILIHSATEEVPFAGAEGVATLGIAMSKEMYPTMTFIAFHVDAKGDLASDYIIIPVEYPNFMEAELFINQHKDHSKRTVEGFAIALPGTYFSISCARTFNYIMQPRSRLTAAKIAMEALKLETFQRTISRVHRHHRYSHEPATVRFLLSGDTEGEAVRTLQSAGLATLTDSKLKNNAYNLGHCEISLGYLECGDGTCYKYTDVCNHVDDCADGRDEMLCQYEFFPARRHNEGLEELELYHLLRLSFWKDLFDEEDAVWAWKTTFIGHGRDEDLGLEVPRTQDEWALDAFALHPEFGFAILEPVLYQSDPPVFIVLEGPTVCRRGEQISVRTSVFNSLPYDLIVLIILPQSDDYRFIHVEDKGVVDAYNPRTSSGEHQHLVFIPAGGMKDIFIPVAIVLQRGTVEITIRMSSQMAWDQESLEIEIKPEGAPVYKHTSVLLDLKSRALYYEYLNIPIDESPEISLTIFRRFVYGSPEAKLTLSGDVFGPISEDISVAYESAFKGRSLKSTDGLAFNFGATLWTLHYLRLTNQLDLGQSLTAFEFMNVQMAGMLTRFRDGGFKMWHYSGPSVWLTAHVVNMLKSAMLEDWENLIYVDPRVLTDAANFMLRHQNPQGDFYENNLTNVTLDSKYNYKKSYERNVSIGITAYVTATLQEILNTLPGKTRARTSQAIWRGMRFLERSLPSLSDPYDVAITTWALSIIGSSEKDVAISKLLKIARPQDGFIYWARKKIVTHVRIRENNQRPFLLPKEPQEWDSHAIEATSYALLVLLNREGVILRQERIVEWLISVRDWDYAFSSTSDSIIALRALTEYCYRARLRDVTDLTVEVEATSTNDFKETIRIEQPFVSMIQQLEIPNAWGHLTITGRGAGQALAQMTTTWGVDLSSYLERPPREYFSLSVREYHHQARNKSRITTTVCTHWLATDLSPTSHSAMVEIEVPSGYFAHQPELNKGVRAAKRDKFPEIADAFISESYIFFQFNYIPSNDQCFTYDLHRWHPVANLTFIRSAMVFELFAPEHFEQIIINSTTLSALDICEVCGSYQCPYCFYYSGAPPIGSSILVLFLIMIAIHEATYLLWSQRSWTYNVLRGLT